MCVYVSNYNNEVILISSVVPTTITVNVAMVMVITVWLLGQRVHFRDLI